MGTAEIQKIFKVSNAGKVAGSKVTDGEVLSASNARLIRDGAIIYTGKIGYLFSFLRSILPNLLKLLGI